MCMAAIAVDALNSLIRASTLTLAALTTSVMAAGVVSSADARLDLNASSLNVSIVPASKKVAWTTCSFPLLEPPGGDGRGIGGECGCMGDGGSSGGNGGVKLGGGGDGVAGDLALRDVRTHQLTPAAPEGPAYLHEH